jgi:hypothetical protein
MDIPFPVDVSDSLEDKTDLSYTILFDYGTTASIPFSQMAILIPPPLVAPTTTDCADSLLPPFLCLDSWITFKHEGQYHKEYLHQLNGIYPFSYKSHANKRQEDWGVPFQISPPLGLIYASRASSFLAMSLTLSFGPHLCSYPLLLIPWPHLSVPSTSIRTAHLLFSKHWQTLIPTGRFGCVIGHGLMAGNIAC